jgi:hypothetical protein
LSNVLSEIGGSRIAQIYAAVWHCTLTAAARFASFVARGPLDGFQ